MVDARRHTFHVGLLIIAFLQAAQAQVFNSGIYEKKIQFLKNADFDVLGSNAFSYKKSLPTLENIIERLAFDGSVLANLSIECAEDVGLIMTEAMNMYLGGEGTDFKQTMMQIIDSSGKPGAGILLGNTKWYGLFKQCQAVEYDLGNRTFAGKYSHVQFAIGGANETTCYDNSYTIDLCLPKTCSTIDIFTLIDGISGDQITCDVQSLPRKPHTNAGTWITLAIIAIVLFLGLTASIFDYFVLPYHKNKPYTKLLWIQCWRSFSFYTNVVEVFNTKGANKPGNIGPLHCMRFFSMCWVVMGHGLSFCLWLSINPLSFLDLQQHRIFGILSNAYLSVDTFFWQSGLLLTFVWLKKFKQNKQQVMSAQAWILFYVHRIVRISPAYYLVIAFYTFIYLPFATKNMSIDAEWTTNVCKDNWWINFLYINNFVRHKDQCYSVSWYLSTDMQIFVFTPVILIPLAIKRSYGVIMALVILALSTGANIAQMYHYYFPPTIRFTMYGKDPRMTVDTEVYKILMYYAPWIRCQVYIVGMLTGILLQSVKKIRIPIIAQIIGWITTIAIAYGCLFSLKSYFLGDPIPLGWRTLYSAASKPLWGVALSWIVITCYYGYGSFVNSFMSWTIWVPLGRLSYSTYLIQIIVVNYLIGQNQQLFVYSNFFQMFTMYILPLIFCSLVFALFWTTAFELGFGKLEAILIGALIHKSKPKASPTMKTSVPQLKGYHRKTSNGFAVGPTDLTHRKQQTNATIEMPHLNDKESAKNADER